MATRSKTAWASGLLKLPGRFPLFFSWILAVLLLGMWGSWAGPGWNAQALGEQIIPQTSDTAVRSGGFTPKLGTYEVIESDHEITTEYATVRVRLRQPRGLSNNPAVVFIHGTGTASYEAFAQHATWLAEAGITTAVPDKLATGYSLRQRDYLLQGQTYNEVAAWLRTQGVSEVGYYGESEGGLIGPVAAAADPLSAFLVLVSSPAMPLRDQGAMAATTYLHQIGAPDALLPGIPRLISGTLVAGEFGYANFDPAPYHQQLHAPVMMLYGTDDYSMPIVQGPKKLVSQLDDVDYLLRYYQDADHGLRIAGELQPQPYQDIADFINGGPEVFAYSPTVAGAQPHQYFTVKPVSHPRWFGSAQAMAVLLASGLTLTVVGLVLTAFRRPKNLGPVRGYMVLSAILTVVSWVAFVWYLYEITKLALAYEQNSLLVSGGWLGVEVLALATLFSFVWALRKWRLSPDKRFASHMWILGSGISLLLLALAYWGVYPPVWS